MLEAVAMSHAALSDPQFRLPSRPRFAEGLVVVPSDGGVIVEGGPTRQLLGGRSAAAVLDRLIPLLDGEHGLEELAAESGRSLADTHATVALLYASGLLEDGAVAPEVGDADPQAIAFYARTIDSTRVNASGAQAMQRLRASRAVVAADARSRGFAEMIAAELTAGGVGSVDLVDAGSTAVDSALVLLVGASPLLSRTAAAAAAEGAGAYPVRLDGEQLLYGPFVEPSYTPHYDDLALQIDAEAGTAEPTDEPAFAAAMVAGDVLALLSRVGAVPSQQSLVRLDLRTLVQERLVAVSSTPDGIPLAYAFEASTAFPPRSLASPKDHQVHYKQSNIVLQRESKRWPSAPTTPLTQRAAIRQVDGLPDPAAPATATDLTAGMLADIVTRTAGNRDEGTPREGKVRRWAATGGNLGSVQAYVLARRVDGLAAGVYGYQRGDDSYALLPWADPSADLAGVSESADAVLVLTGALGRVASKYAAFSWRIVHLDAGVALAQARLLAAAHGVHTEVAPAWDDDAVAALLGIDQDAEPITAVVSLTTRRPEGSRR
ncbi:SagB/ThcOx family dehydrogenase [Microbacterium oryzae]|uniref:SagB/ThcOx family dehydrogenase n=1 Tax=Microbacterium oryzae TaxID=743009 RepID=A0A6I6E1L3_9MICO|nr:SagB/ThcOx family dehydrogenase [Microbacterium oryzae]